MIDTAKGLALLATAGLLLLLLTRLEWAEPAPMAGPGVRSEGRADSAPADAAERRYLEDWHGNVSVTPRNRGGARR